MKYIMMAQQMRQDTPLLISKGKLQQRINKIQMSHVVAMGKEVKITNKLSE